MNTADPTLIKTQVGGSPLTVTNLDWLTDVIHLDLLPEFTLPHQKRQLNADGYGAIHLQ